MQPFSDWVRVHRTARGWSQADLGRASTIDASNITRWEAGAVRPSPANLQKLAPALGVPYSELLQRCGYLPDDDLVEAPVPTELQARLQRLGVRLSRHPRRVGLAVLEAYERMADALVAEPPVSARKRPRVSAPIARLTRGEPPSRGQLTTQKQILQALLDLPLLILPPLAWFCDSTG